MTIPLHPRTAVLAYALDTLRDAVDVGGRVYLSRPNALDTYELPAVCLYFTGESSSVVAGSPRIPDEYRRTLTVRVDVLCEQPIPYGDVTVSTAEARLDGYARQVELAMADDVFFARRFPGYNGSLTDICLLEGSLLQSVEPYELEIGDRVIGCQSLTYELDYLDRVFAERKLPWFEQYLVEIRKAGWTEETVDPVLTSAEGDI